MTSKSASIEVDPEAGGRLSSLVIAGHELLVARTPDPLDWGCYPLVPFAGRVRGGKLHFENRTTPLPLGLGAHAIHGFGFISPWTRVDHDRIEFDLPEPWPYRGITSQTFALRENELKITMCFEARDRQPVSLGWHPWFRRDIGTGSSLELRFEAGALYERDGAGIPSGRTVPVHEGPWDDCFTDVRSPPELRWGDLTVRLNTSVDHWVVYDEPDHAVCVEPHSGPPNDVNDAPRIVEAGESYSIDFTMAWTSD